MALRGHEVSRLCFDHAVVLEMAGAELRIETPFTLRVVGSQHAHDVLPDRVGDTGSMMLGLLREVILDVVVEESGHLSVEFAGGQRLECPPDPRLEAWTLVTSSGELVVCMPGGGVACWPGSGAR